jgi:N6-adenosine-specific RNA methylase IME4
MYSIVYADPPWLYKCGVNHLTKISMINGKEDNHYKSMELFDIKNLNVQSISADNCLLFMWVTSPFLEYGIEVLNAWEFKYSTIGFVWHKQRYIPGSYTMSECELCLIGKRGKIPTPRGKRNVKQYLTEKLKVHSEKPEEVATRINLMFPELKKIELFARKERAGWDVWGNEVKSNIELASRFS